MTNSRSQKTPVHHRARHARLAAIVAITTAGLITAGGCSGSDTTSSDAAADGSTSTAAVTADPGDVTTTSVEPADVPAVASAGCGTPAPPTGQSTETMQAGGIERTYLQYIPEQAASGRPLPLVIDLHGYVEGAVIHALTSKLGEFGNTKGFITLTPDGTGSPKFWNATQAEGVVDDVGYITALLDSVESSQCIDTRRVFVTGLSNGAFMTSRLACVLSSRLAAAAPVAGTLVFDDCTTTDRPVPVVSFHGTADTFVGFEGVAGEGAATLPGNETSKAVFGKIKFLPVVDAVSAWALRNGCSGGPADERIADDIIVKRWAGCPSGADAELYVIEGGGHTWPGSSFLAGASSIVGRTTTSIDADAVMWSFFETHPLRD